MEFFSSSLRRELNGKNKGFGRKILQLKNPVNEGKNVEEKNLQVSGFRLLAESQKMGFLHSVKKKNTNWLTSLACEQASEWGRANKKRKNKRERSEPSGT